MNGKTWKFALALPAIALVLALAGWLFLNFANPQWHWRLYAWQSSVLPDGGLEPSPGYSGTWNNWDGNGRLLSTYSYRDGKRDGPYQTFDSAERPLSRGQYSAGQLEGVQTINQEGGARTEITYRNGKRDGKEKTWFPSGQLAVEAPWVDGSQNGSVTFYHENGSLQASIPFYDDKIEGVHKTWHENGRIQAEETYSRGRKNGPSVFWNTEGGMEMRLNYLNDKMDGTQTWFHPNGGKAREVNLFQGVPQGPWREWNENGDPLADDEYDRGELKRKPEAAAGD